MALPIEQRAGFSLPIPRLLRGANTSSGHQEILTRKPSVMRNIRSAAATGNPQTIERVKEAAREEGRLWGLIATVILFNAENYRGQ